MNNLLTKEKPVIFNAHDVRSILDGNKTMFRQVSKPLIESNAVWISRDPFFVKHIPKSIKTWRIISPKYKVNDILYVREAWAYGEFQARKDRFGNEEYYIDQSNTKEVVFKEWAISNDIDMDDVKWKSPVTMPLETARLFLKVTGVRLERLQDISEEAARAEGVITNSAVKVSSYVYWFKDAWDERNKKKGYDWQSNPYVWVYEFERAEI